MVSHLLARGLVGSHHAWADCMPTLFPTYMQVFVHQSLDCCLGTTQLAMRILMRVALGCNVAHTTLPQITPPLCVAARDLSYVLLCASQHMRVAYLEHPAPLQ